MKINRIHNMLCIFIFFILSGFTNQKDSIKITYIANCGFLYENLSSKVLIDPFGTEFGNFFFLPTTETKTKIDEGKTPFNNIDLVLITHIHGDHFNAYSAESFLLKNKNAKMICPNQVYKQIKDSCATFNQIKSQIISPEIAMNGLKTININNISITAVRMQHGTNRSLEGIEYNDFTDYEKTENFGYLIDFNKKVVFHQGDASLKINSETIQMLNRKVDISYLGYFDWDSVSFNILKKDLQTEHIIFMHGTKPGKELQNENFKTIESELIFFKQELESIEM